jgi:hypothetical protein
MSWFGKYKSWFGLINSMDKAGPHFMKGLVCGSIILMLVPTPF